MKKLLLALLIVPLLDFGQTVSLKHHLRILSLGDSYTIGQSVALNERWPMQLSDSLAKVGCTTDTMRIIATTGWRTDDLLNAIKGQNLQQQQYNLVSLLIGVNNQFQGKPFSQYVTEFKALVDSAIRYAGNDKGHVFIVSIPDYAYTPYGQSTPNPSQISADIDQYNNYNKHLADSLGITYFDITPISRKGLDSTSYVASDGLHPGGRQYSKWVELMLMNMKPEILTGISTQVKTNLEFTLFPNPAKDVIGINLKGKNTTTVSVVEIYNAGGEIVYSGTFKGQSMQLSTYRLAAGYYIVKLKSDKLISTKKLIIE
ncbi:hypothetical protein CNR22_01310 [Sphingobacteriaceae bacterium]|nr:hypothetical protein CNR22_01310 [Sphingobacteriaceae bacterium]